MLSLSKYLANFSSSHFSSKYLGDGTSLKPPLFYTPVLQQRRLIMVGFVNLIIIMSGLIQLGMLKLLELMNENRALAKFTKKT